MNRPFALLLLTGSLLLSACGPTAGQACEGGGYACGDEATALECRERKWRPLPCKGSGGCVEQDGSVRCDMAGNVAGDACAFSSEGRGLCTADGKGLLECRMGVLVRVRECSTCTMTSSNVTCQP
jgi:hypothetical protein